MIDCELGMMAALICLYGFQIRGLHIILQIMTDTPSKQDHQNIIKLTQSAAQHYDKQTNKLLDYFEKEYAIPDPLKLMGQRFKDKEKQFASLRKQNTDLKMQARDLNQQIERLKISLGGSAAVQHGSMMQSIDQEGLANRMVQSVYPAGKTTFDTSNILSKMSSIQGMKEEARTQFRNMQKEYDELIETVLRHLSYIGHFNTLKEVAPVLSEGEKVLVERHKYKQLVEVYALSMSRAVMEDLRQKNKSESVKVEEQGDESVRNEPFLEQYGCLLKREDVATKDLGQLFKALAMRAGLSQEWERYHREHHNEAVRKMQEIEKILTYDRVEQSQDEKKAEQEMRDRFLKKMDGLAFSLEFTQAERTYWSCLKEKVVKDRFINSERLVAQLEEKWKEERRCRADLMAGIIEIGMKSALEGVEKIVSARSKRSFLTPRCIEGIVGDGQKLRDELAGVQDIDSLWQCGQDLLSQRIGQSLDRLGQSLIFMSRGDLLRHRYPIHC